MMLARVGAYLATVALVQFFFSSFLITAFCSTVIILFTGGAEPLEIFFTTLPRDLRAAYCLVKFAYLHKRNKTHNKTIPLLFEERFHLHPQKLALQQENDRWTYKMLNDYSNAYGNYFQKQGVTHGDTVSVFVDNRLDYVALWLGLAKIGATSALINFNLRKDALAHCINVSQSKVVVLLGSLKGAVEEVRADLKNKDTRFYVICSDDDDKEQSGDGDGYVSIDDVTSTESRLPPKRPTRASYSDKLLYIYTSGTTGVPKAAVISHSRFYYLATISHIMVNYKPTDSIYCTLPLYHSNGGIVGVGQCLLHGIPVTVRSKFSASRFWSECKRYDCTVFLYIGEICRYLLAQPERASDRDHSVRVGTGNGLRPEIWKEFVSRFNVAKINELYGATEGNANMMNITNVTGSCGFVSVIAPSVYPLCLVRVDDEMNLVRDKNNFCIRCPPGEAGMLIGEIKQGNATREFEGYADEKATASKVSRNVFAKGDSYFLTGDVLVGDKYGNMFFKDRTGDTFRWKGENVSTAECEAELTKVLDNQLTVAVYGVAIPGSDGKAGMATVEDSQEQLNLEQFYLGVNKALPSYARPIFVRVASQVAMTGTHKLAKSKLKREGYDLDAVSDPIYVIDPANKSYKRMTRELYDDITAGKVRL